MAGPVELECQAVRHGCGSPMKVGYMFIDQLALLHCLNMNFSRNDFYPAGGECESRQESPW